MVERARLCTADDLAAMTEDGLRYALVRGELIAMPPTSDIHGEIALMLSLLIGNFVRANNLGLLPNFRLPVSQIFAVLDEP
jgi:Uma2 family endonuclease